MASGGIFEDEQFPLTIKTEEIEIFSEIPDEQIDDETSQESAEHGDVPSSKKYKCYLCTRKTVLLESKESLRAHLGTAHPRQETYNCDKCNLSMKQIVSLNSHLARHDASVRPHKCTQCPLRFAINYRRKLHEMSVHGIGVEKAKTHCCTICGKTFFLKNQLNEHQRKKHSTQKVELLRNVLKCYLCPTDAVFDNKNALYQHLNINHEQKDRYHCNKCDFSVDVMKTFNNHLSRHDDKGRPFSCSICFLRFPKHIQKLDHESKVHEIANGREPKRVAFREMEKKFACSECGVKFAYRYLLKKHEQKHLGKPTVRRSQRKCHLCSTNNIFDDKQALAEHFEEVHPIPAKAMYICNECDYSTNNMFFFNNHVSRHDLTRPYKCSRCEERYTLRSAMLQHEAYIHGADNGYMFFCSKCETRFSNKATLQGHERKMHRNDKPQDDSNQCSICQKKFIDRPKRIQHERSKHGTAEKESDFECYLCDNLLIFSSKECLARHLRNLHPNKSVYKCDLCSYARRSIVEFNSHYSRHKSNPATTELIIKIEAEDSPHEDIDASSSANVTKNFKCYLCNTSDPLESSESLVDHLMSTHLEQDEYRCGKCDFSVDKITKYNQHLSQHER